MNLNVFYALVLLALIPMAMASNTTQYELVISSHRFEPAELIIPTNTKVRLVIHNQDNNYEEFHSDDLQREKILNPKQSGIVSIGPLSPGTYDFMGEFHPETAKGRIIVR